MKKLEILSLVVCKQSFWRFVSPNIRNFVYRLLPLLLCTGCQKNHTPLPTSQQLRLNIHSEPPSLDPRKATDTVSVNVLKACFEGLTRLDQNGAPSLAIAEKIDVSRDKKRYTFFLRESVWSDGHPVTAYDFEASWKKILDPCFPTEIGLDLYVIANAKEAKMNLCPLDEVGIRALDEKTFQVDLNYPVPYFLSMTASPPLFPTPSHITSVHPNWAEHSGPHFVSNGPFLINHWHHHSKIVLTKNPTYWDKEQVRLEKLNLLIIEDENTELTMFENGELDWVGYPLSAIPIDALPSLNKKGLVEYHPIAGVYYYIFNTQLFPFNNTHIRKALSLAINRQAIVDNITQSGQLPAMSLIPPIMWDQSTPYFKDSDIAEARRQLKLGLEELGIPHNQLPKLILSYNTLSSHHKIAQAIQQQWENALNVKVSLENKEWKVFLNEVRNNQFAVARMGGVASIHDPITFLDLYRYESRNGNHSKWTNPTYTALLEKAEREKNPETRLQFLKEAESLLIEEMPIAPIYFYSGSYMKKPYVHNVVFSDLNDADFKWAYVDTKEKK